MIRSLLIFSLALLAAAAEPRYDWPSIAQSRLDIELAGMAQKLAPRLLGKRVLMAPFMGNRHHLNPWAFETIAEERFAAALHRAAITVVSDAPLRARFRSETAGLPPAIPYSTKGLIELATLCGADVVVLGGVQILSETSITIYVYDGHDGRRLAKEECELLADDVVIPALTPAANRALVEWAELPLGTRFSDGTASGFAQAAITQGKATLQSPRTLPLPGDVVLWWEPWRRIRRPRCGVLLALTGIGRAEMIVQRRSGAGAPVVEIQQVDFHGFPWAVIRPQGSPTR